MGTGLGDLVGEGGGTRGKVGALECLDRVYQGGKVVRWIGGLQRGDDCVEIGADIQVAGDDAELGDRAELPAAIPASWSSGPSIAESVHPAPRPMATMSNPRPVVLIEYLLREIGLFCAKYLARQDPRLAALLLGLPPRRRDETVGPPAGLVHQPLRLVV